MMRRLLYLAMLAMLAMLLFATTAGAQQGPSCPAGEVNILQSDGTFICAAEGIEDRTPEQIAAGANDPRSNAETPTDEQQQLDFSQLTPEQARAAGFNVPADTGDTCPAGTIGSGDQGAGEFACVPSGEDTSAPAPEEAPAEALAPDAEVPTEAPAPGVEVPAEETPAVPAEAPDTGITALPETGGPALLLAAAALLVGSGLLGLASLRRRG